MFTLFFLFPATCFHGIDIGDAPFKFSFSWQQVKLSYWSYYNYTCPNS